MPSPDDSTSTGMHYHVHSLIQLTFLNMQEHHDGPHSHTMNANVVDFCDTRCQACQYFCNLPFMHAGLHNTTHGNMRSVNFVSEVQDFEILDRKYTWGESGLAEMCMMYCKAQGRGHIHLTPCQKHNNGACAGKIMEGSDPCVQNMVAHICAFNLKLSL